MDDVEELVRLARGLAEEVVGVASELLSAGTDIEHVQGRYVAVAVELLADAEARSLLAAGGHPDALAALARVAGELAGLRDKARAEAQPVRGALSVSERPRAPRSDEPSPRRPPAADRRRDKA
jgi:hypothetical protein